MLKPLSIEREPRLDWLQMVALLLLISIGCLFIWSASAGDVSSSTPWYGLLPVRQLVWCGIGITGAVLICLVDYRTLSRYAMVAYWAGMILLVVLFIPGIGARRFGATRWIDLGLMQFQPSEFGKLAFVFAMAHFLSRPQDELRQPKVVAKALGLMALPFVLILKEPDLGSALLIVPVGVMMMFVGGVPLHWLKRLVGGSALLVGLMVVNILFAPESVKVGGFRVRTRIPIEDYQRHRLLVYFDQDYVPSDASPEVRRKAADQKRNDSYNVEQALISVGSGGLTGKGWRQGTQNALGYLPRGVAHNDFIFSVIAEESGFLGSVTVVALYTVILFTGIRIASQARDRLGRLLAVGVVSLILTQVFINIGMNIRLMPVTGVPLPLLSYGGSSVLGSLIAAGMLQNVYFHRRSY